MIEWGKRQMTLLSFVAEMADECYIGRYDEKRVTKEIDNPEWENHPWCKGVPDGFKRNWKNLSLDTRLGIFAMACVRAT